MAKKSNKARSDGRIRIKFTYNGKVYYSYGRTQKEADEKARAKRQQLEAGQYKKSTVLTFNEYYKRWSDAREGTVKGATLRKQKFQYEAITAVQIDDNRNTFGSLPLKEIEVQHIRILQKKLLIRTDAKGNPAKGKKERTPQSVNDMIAFVSHVLHDAVNERAIDWNPCNGVKNLKRTEKPARETIHRALTEDELKSFFHAAKNMGEGEEKKSSWYLPLYEFLLASGCRCGEAAALYVSDIKPDKIMIRRTVTKDEIGCYVIGDTTKTSYGTRTIPMTDAIREAIRKQRDINAAVFGADVIGMNETIFKTSWGNLLAVANVDRDIAKICKKAGIEKFTAHAFRDTFATICIEKGMNPKTLQSILGHADFSLTMSLYAHSMEETKAKEMVSISIAQ